MSDLSLLKRDGGQQADKGGEKGRDKSRDSIASSGRSRRSSGSALTGGASSDDEMSLLHQVGLQQKQFKDQYQRQLQQQQLHQQHAHRDSSSTAGMMDRYEYDKVNIEVGRRENGPI